MYSRILYDNKFKYGCLKNLETSDGVQFNRELGFRPKSSRNRMILLGVISETWIIRFGCLLLWLWCDHWKCPPSFEINPDEHVGDDPWITGYSDEDEGIGKYPFFLVDKTRTYFDFSTFTAVSLIIILCWDVTFIYISLLWLIFNNRTGKIT